MDWWKYWNKLEKYMILNHSSLYYIVFLYSRDIYFTVVHALLQLVSMFFIDLLYMVSTLVKIPSITSVCENCLLNNNHYTV